MHRLALVTLFIFAPAGVVAQEVAQRTEHLDDGSIMTVHQVVVPATVDEVWQALTTSDGVMSWAVPFAEVDFRLNGIWESSYVRSATLGDPANIRNKFLSYVPKRMMAMQAVQAPMDFQHPEVLAELFSVFEIDPVGDDSTRVVVYGVGYRDTPQMNSVRQMFEGGNAWSMQKLYERFANGPIQWDQVLQGSGQ